MGAVIAVMSVSKHNADIEAMMFIAFIAVLRAMKK